MPSSDPSRQRELAQLTPLELMKGAFEAGVLAKDSMIASFQLAQSGDLRSAAGEYDKFLTAQREVVALTEQLNGVWATPSPLEPVVQPLVNGLFMYADLLDSLTDAAGADRLRAEAVDVAARYLGKAGVAEAKRSSVASLTARGRFPEALVALFAARDFFTEAERPLKAARVSMDLADMHQWLGDYDQASALVAQAVAAADAVEKSGGAQAPDEAMELRRIRVEAPFYNGMIARFAGRYEEAQRELDEAIKLYQFDQGALVGVEFQRAMVLPKVGRHEEALAMLERLEARMHDDQRLRPKLAAVLRGQAEALLGLGRVDEALARITAAVQEGERYFDPEVRWSVSWQQALVLRALGRDDDALGAYGAAIGALALQRRAPLGYRLDNAYVASRLAVFQEAIHFAASLDRPVECALFIEEIKARSLTAIMGAGDRASAADPALSQAFADVTRTLDALEFQAFATGWTTEAKAKHGQLLDTRSKLLERLRVSDPRWRSLTQPARLDVPALIATLTRRQQAVLTLYLTGDQLTCVLLAPQAQLVRRTTLPPGVVAKLDAYVANLGEAEFDHHVFDVSATLGLSATDLVPKDVWDVALGCASVIVVPHARLHLLPWSSLVLDGARLFERRPVGVLPNLACVAHLDFEPATRPAVTLAGAPAYDPSQKFDVLPGAASELEELAKLYRKAGLLQGEPLMGARAGEAAFLALFQRSGERGGLLHACCHASTDVDEPMSSGLYLTDGKVDAAEIAAAGVPFDEVILSACSTGWRPSQVANVELVADDCLGLPGAFLEGGARSVLVSIPPAADEASTAFMLAYHGARAEGTPPLASYQAAQRAMLGAGQYAPELWVGFTMYGCR